MKEKEIYNVLSETYYGDKCHERKEIENLSKIAEGFDVDVGASLGQYTKRFNEIADKKIIISIEADPIRFQYLEEINCKHNTNNVIKTVFGAAADKSGEITFYTTQSNISGGFGKLPNKASNWKKVQVPVFLLDDVVEKYENVFIKMDIEGGEYSALLGAEKLLEGNNTFLLELHYWGDPRYNKYPKDVIFLFRDKGYTMKKYFQHFLFFKSKVSIRDAFLMHLVSAYYRFKLFKNHLLKIAK